jgi:hypothetical protein
MGLPKGLSVVSKQDVTIYTLYQTDIVEINHATKSLILRTGGWNGPHTKKCINLALKEFSINVRQIKGKWYVFQYDTKNVNGCGTDKLRHDAFPFQNDTITLTLD